MNWRALFLAFAWSITLSGCNPARKAFYDSLDGTGGGRDLIEVDLPFAEGYRTKCVQGVGGGYSHHFNSTYYDMDLDTPNDRDDALYAPVRAVAYVHEDLTSGFGIHVNLDLDDGTYINLSHLAAPFVENGEHVVPGQLIGFEGTTGNSEGDHVHMGRHLGAPDMDAGYGTSIEGLALLVADGSSVMGVPVVNAACDLYSGDVFTSVLPVTKWHPNGSLIMEAGKSTVYLVHDGTKRPFLNQQVFWSHNHAFRNVSVVGPDEAACYPTGSMISSESQVQVVYDGDNLWLLVGRASDVDRARYKVRSVGWQGVLQSWGVHVNNMQDAYSAELVEFMGSYPEAGYAKYRDGSLVVGIDNPDVFLVSNGAAMPIDDWETFLLMDLIDHDVIEVEDASIPAVMNQVGSCSTDVLCIDHTDVTVCGNPDDVDDLPAGTDIDTSDPDIDDQIDNECGWHTLSWTVSSAASDGEFLSSAHDAELWVLETGEWWGSPAAVQSGATVELATELYACSGEVFTVNGTFTNYADTPHSGNGQWWMCADPWDPRYWGSFKIDGNVLTDDVSTFMVDSDASGGPSGGDEVGCHVTVR